MQVDYSVGIDPGIKNLGIALLSKSIRGVELIHSITLNPSEMSDDKRCRQILSEITKHVTSKDVGYLTVERFVAYKGISSRDSEDILLCIGGLIEAGRHLFSEAEINLVRAIDWKIFTAKALTILKNISNPGTSLDKKFSVHAANSCLDVPNTFKTDHEADAIVLAANPFLKKALSEIRKQPKFNKRTIV